MFNPKSQKLWLIVVAFAVAAVVVAATSCVGVAYGCSASPMTMCLKPLHLVDEETGRTRIVPCGKCNACLVRARAEWVLRLREEDRLAASSYFLTLTYDNEHLPIGEYFDPETGVCIYNGYVCKEDVVKFNKRFRKYLENHFGVSIRFYLISEYGPETLRPHYHGLYFFDQVLSAEDVHTAAVAAWPFCEPRRLTVGTITDERIKYVTEYCLTKNGIPEYLEPNFRLMSRNPGLGKGYVDRMKAWHLADTSRFYAPQPGGRDHCNLPRYYRDKIYPKDVREERAADIEAQKLQEEIAIRTAPGFDPEKYERDRRAFIRDYNRRTERFLNKKLKKI